MGLLVNIDNGGTLTDICVADGPKIYRTKTLTTPFDLSKCFFDGLVKVSKEIYGQEDIVSLLSTTDHIRYSTTQGTNALVERKGPRLGLLTSGSMSDGALKSSPEYGGLFDALVGGRVAAVDVAQDDAALAAALTREINHLASSGANRIVVAHGGADCAGVEKRLKSILLRKFPQHLLGAVPILYSHEVVEDEDDPRRTWTALLNAFLHPAMERFLYNAEHKLRNNKSRNPLLIFRNDGHSARVAKTIAIKTYSSGPRGGMEGARAMAEHFGFKHLVSVDIGGTTTDICEVHGGQVREDDHGKVEGVEVSFPLPNVVSVGVGGSSIIKAVDGAIRIGPESVGSEPGPACFGLGGTEATITDAFLLTGLLDPASYFGGELSIDVERARKAIRTHVADPLGISEEEAATRMETAWAQKVADGILAFTTITPDTTLAAFGGAGPMVICKVAEAAGVNRVIIPGLAAVFSAFGLGFSDIAHQYEQRLSDPAQIDACVDKLMARARRGMYAEGFALKDCEIDRCVRVSGPDGERELPLSDDLATAQLGDNFTVRLDVSKAMPQPTIEGAFGAGNAPAVNDGTRHLMTEGQFADVPVYRVEAQSGGASAAGPAVLEEKFFTARIEPGWTIAFSENRDVLLTRDGA